VAAPPELELSFEGLADDWQQAGGRQARLADVLEPIADDDPRFRPVLYLDTKTERDQAKGNGFKRQFIEPSSTSVPTLRKGYHKGGSTDPRLVHPSNGELSRLLTATEHARIKGIDPALVEGAGECIGHQICGQAVDTRPVRALAQEIGVAIGRALQAFSAKAVGQPINGAPHDAPSKPKRRGPVALVAA
jgi:DNA (cytosine-5)-methyltransferase 1